jgi:hypothetical protein
VACEAFEPQLARKRSALATIWGCHTPKGRWQIAGLPPGED